MKEGGFGGVSSEQLLICQQRAYRGSPERVQNVVKDAINFYPGYYHAMNIVMNMIYPMITNVMVKRSEIEKDEC